MTGDAKGEYRGLAYRDEHALKAWLAKRPSEAALEPGLPIIDPHHHFWDTPQRGRYLLPELLADIGGGSAEGGAVERHMIGFQSAYARRGVKLELGERLALGYQFHIASNREQAIREAAPHYEENMKMFGELRLVRALTDEQIAAMRDPRLAATAKLPTIEDAVKAGGFLAGRPEDIVEQLKAVEKRYPGLDRVICATPLGTPLDVQLADLDRFAKEVIPAFRSAAAPTRVAAE